MKNVQNILDLIIKRYGVEERYLMNHNIRTFYLQLMEKSTNLVKERDCNWWVV